MAIFVEKIEIRERCILAKLFKIYVACSPLASPLGRLGSFPWVLRYGNWTTATEYHGVAILLRRTYCLFSLFRGWGLVRLVYFRTFCRHLFTLGIFNLNFFVKNCWIFCWFLQNVAKFARICWIFAEFLLIFSNFFRDFPKMQQFWENPKIAHLIFVLEMRTFNFRFEKHLIFNFT